MVTTASTHLAGAKVCSPYARDGRVGSVRTELSRLNHGLEVAWPEYTVNYMQMLPRCNRIMHGRHANTEPVAAHMRSFVSEQKFQKRTCEQHGRVGAGALPSRRQRVQSTT